MKITQLHLKQFRNLAECTLTPSEGLNLLIGSNGQGKTSILEGISLIALMRSFRSSHAYEWIQWKKEEASLTATIQWLDVQSELKVALQRASEQTTKKTAFINKKPFKSSVQYLSQRFGEQQLGVHAIVFNPADHDLVRGDPSQRRSYLDRVCAAESYEYLKNLKKYVRVLDQRNALLKQVPSCSPQHLDGFTQPLCELAAVLVHERLLWINKLNPMLKKMNEKIIKQTDDLHAYYSCSWLTEIDGLTKNNRELNSSKSLHFTGLPPTPSIELIYRSLTELFLKNRFAEIRAQSTLFGPHRDDWTFFYRGQPIKGYGSQGEVRSALLALKLSEIELFQEKTGHEPLLLLDDFSSELDEQRRTALLDFLVARGLQVFVTTTDMKLGELKIIKKAKVFIVKNGSVNEWRGVDT